MKNKLVALSAFGLLLLSPHLASAQVSGFTPLPPATIAAFTANPGSLLTQFANGGPGLQKQVADLLESDKSLLSALIALLAGASDDQKTAIAKGLANAAQAYVQTDPATATVIQTAVASSGFPSVVTAFATAGGNTATASTGGGGGGGGGGGPTSGGAPTGGGSSGGASPTGTNFTANSSGNLLTGGTVGSSGGAAGSTSPH